MKLILDTGICHIINVGMYESLIDPRYLFEDDENKVEFSDVLTQEEKDYFERKCYMEWDSKAYDKLVAGYAMEIIKEFLDSLCDTIKITLCGKGVINSPPYYNNLTDELKFEIEIEQSQIDNIQISVQNNPHFFEWAQRYRSYPGFISFMPHYKDEYMEAIKGKDLNRSVAMYLTYLYDEQNNFKEHEFGHTYDLYEKISSNHIITEFINDERAVEIYGKAYEGEAV